MIIENEIHFKMNIVLPCLFLRLFLDVGECYFRFDDHPMDYETDHICSAIERHCI